MIIMSNGMVEVEVPVSKEDKEQILSYWNKISAILNKYESTSCPTDYATTMSRVKSAVAGFSEWANLLYVIWEVRGI